MIVDYDVVIIGGGPAGLTAGMYLARGKNRVLVLEREAFGGQVKNVSWIDNYPGYSQGVAGSVLASEMVNQAIRWGVDLEQREVTEVDSYSTCRMVSCSDGKGYTCHIVIVAGGSRAKKLGVPGEDRLQGKGVIQCAACDGARFGNKVVAVCGGGDAGISEALYMANLSSKVILIEVRPALTGTAILQERVYAASNIEIRCGERVTEVSGDDSVEAVRVVNVASGAIETLPVDGVLIHVGIQPSTEYLRDFLGLDREGQILVNHGLEAQTPGFFAAGDIRSGSPRQVAAAVGDGAIAATAAQGFLLRTK